MVIHLRIFMVQELQVQNKIQHNQINGVDMHNTYVFWSILDEEIF